MSGVGISKPAPSQARGRFLSGFAVAEASALLAGTVLVAGGMVAGAGGQAAGYAIAAVWCMLSGRHIAQRWSSWKKAKKARSTWDVPREFDAELKAVAARRNTAAVPNTGAPFGIALSGGGVRSASISLGFLQELDREGVLRRADYLSTVSGGGWAGGAYTLSAHPPDNTGATAPWASLGEHLVNRGSAFLCNSASGAARLGAFLAAYGLWAMAVSIGIIGALSLFALAFLSLLSLGINVPPAFRAGPVVDLSNEFLFSVLGFTNSTIDDVPVGEVLLPTSWQTMLLASGIGASVLGRWLNTERRRAVIVDNGYTEVGIALERSGALLLAIVIPALCLTFIHWKIWWLAGLGCGLCATLVLRSRYQRFGLVIGMLVTASTLTGAFVVEELIGLGCLSPVRWVGAVLVGAFELAERVASIVSGPEGANTYAGGNVIESVVSRECVPIIHRINWAHSLDGESAVVALVVLGALALLVIYLIGAADRRLAPSLHGWWSRQISRAFLEGWTRTPDSSLAEARAPSAPLHLINAAFDARSSLVQWLRSVGVGQFVLGPVITGGKDVGWVASEQYSAAIDYAGAIAVSAAAINPIGGRSIPRWASRLFSLMHLRQGRWVASPKHTHSVKTHPLSLFMRELFGKLDETVPSLYVSDGGHEDNLGLATLIERGCETIVVLDAGYDPHAAFNDLQFAFKRLQLETSDTLATLRKMALPKLAPGGQGVCRVSDEVIFSFQVVHRDRKVQVYLAKLALTADMWTTIRRDTTWKDRRRDAFPQDPTWNQFFEPERIAAYREVGRLLASRMMKEFGSALQCQLEQQAS